MPVAVASVDPLRADGAVLGAADRVGVGVGVGVGRDQGVDACLQQLAQQLRRRLGELCLEQGAGSILDLEVIVEAPFESAVRGSLEGSPDGRR